jgi:hypothetical protein
MSRPRIAFADYFADLPDPRVDRTKKHLLGDILVIAVCAVIAGADSLPEVESFGRAKEPWLRRFLALPNGIPSHDTFNRVFAALDRKALAACFARWMAGLCDAVGLRAIAIDGKAARAAPRDTFSGCLHLVSAWAVENHLILGQEAVADGSHEIAAIPKLLRVLDLEGAGDHRRGRLPGRDRTADPGAAGPLAGGQGQPAGAAGVGPRDVRAGLRRGLRRGAPPGARTGRGRARAA